MLDAPVFAVRRRLRNCRDVRLAFSWPRRQLLARLAASALKQAASGRERALG